MASSARALNVLFLCAGNSARSILAESILDSVGRPRFKAFSAGSRPTGRINAFALEYLNASRLPTAKLRSKSWAEFVAAGAPPMDFVITVCDNAAGEACPLWPGQPVTTHWGVPDPALVEGPDARKRAAIADVARVLSNRIQLFTSLPLDKLDRLSLQQALCEIEAASLNI